MTYSIINLKTDPALKIKATKTAKKLGVSLSMVLNNELRRFVTEESVLIESQEVLNAETAKALSTSREAVKKGDYHKFSSNKEALDFLDKEL